MLAVATTTKISRPRLISGKPIKRTCRELRAPRNMARKVTRIFPPEARGSARYIRISWRMNPSIGSCSTFHGAASMARRVSA